MQNSRDNYLILCGNWENSFQIISLSDGRIMQSIRQHKDVVSCVAGIYKTFDVFMLIHSLSNFPELSY
jgi:hypothetical protein